MKYNLSKISPKLQERLGITNQELVNLKNIVKKPTEKRNFKERNILTIFIKRVKKKQLDNMLKW